MIPIEETAAGVSFRVRVQARARRSGISGELGDALKLSLASPPLEGRANQECVEFFADLLEVPRSSVTIASGKTSRNKLIRVAGLKADELQTRLSITITDQMSHRR